MDSRIQENVCAVFKGVFFSEKEGVWVAIDLHFELEGKRWSHRYFSPRSHRQKKKLNSALKHIYETITGQSWELVEHQTIFEKFVKLYREHTLPFVDKQFYIKTLPRGEKWVQLGFELPIISTKSDLFYGDLEEMRIDSANNRVDEGGDSINTTAPATRSSYTAPTAKPIPELPNLKKLMQDEQKSVDASKSTIEKSRPSSNDDIPF